MRKITKSGVIGLAVLVAGFGTTNIVEARGAKNSGSGHYQQKNMKQYRKADADCSGKISSDEFCGSDKRFDKIDKNGDGEIGKKEYKHSKIQQKNRKQNKKQYRKADADCSGKISSDEFRGSQKRFDKIDKNGDGEIGKKEYKSAKNKKMRAERSLKRFQEADEDKNGSLSRGEFAGSDEAFSHLDRNGDGVVSPGEHRLGNYDYDVDDDGDYDDISE
jgi:Ca2+-binding EF-hand superfamily protein